MSIRCWDELLNYGAADVLKREYGSLVKAQPEAEYNATLEINLEDVPAEEGSYMTAWYNLYT